MISNLISSIRAALLVRILDAMGLLRQDDHFPVHIITPSHCLRPPPSTTIPGTPPFDNFITCALLICTFACMMAGLLLVDEQAFSLKARVSRGFNLVMEKLLTVIVVAGIAFDYDPFEIIIRQLATIILFLIPRVVLTIIFLITFSGRAFLRAATAVVPLIWKTLQIDPFELVFRLIFGTITFVSRSVMNTLKLIARAFINMVKLYVWVSVSPPVEVASHLAMRFMSLLIPEDIVEYHVQVALNFFEDHLTRAHACVTQFMYNSLSPNSRLFGAPAYVSPALEIAECCEGSKDLTPWEVQEFHDVLPNQEFPTSISTSSSSSSSSITPSSPSSSTSLSPLLLESHRRVYRWPPTPYLAVRGETINIPLVYKEKKEFYRPGEVIGLGLLGVYV